MRLDKDLAGCCYGIFILHASTNKYTATYRKNSDIESASVAKTAPIHNWLFRDKALITNLSSHLNLEYCMHSEE